MANTSFYVPGSLSGSYVASKRTSEGSLAYPAAETEIGIQKQAALQDLSKQYETTIENAYSSYLASQRNTLESSMGQGYKEQYLQAQDRALAENLAQLNTNVASVRAELETQESSAKEAVRQQYQQEVTNLDRTAASFQNYLDYVKDLSYTDPKTNETIKALGEEYTNLGVDYLYETLYNLQPRETGIDGMSYAEWLQTNIGKTTEDAAWYQWAQSGGLRDFLSAVRSRPDYQTAEQKITANKAAANQNVLNKEQGKGGSAIISATTNIKRLSGPFRAEQPKFEMTDSSGNTTEITTEKLPFTGIEERRIRDQIISSIEKAGGSVRLDTNGFVTNLKDGDIVKATVDGNSNEYLIYQGRFYKILNK